MKEKNASNVMTEYLMIKKTNVKHRLAQQFQEQSDLVKKMLSKCQIEIVNKKRISEIVNENKVP